MSQLSDQIRKQFGESDDRRDEGLVLPENVSRISNLVYGPDEDWQVLDIYRPKSAKNQVLPVIILVHGGGWVYGDKERYQFYAADMAARGFALISFTYRLAPEFQFPAPIEDLNLVLKWLFKNADAFQMDSSKLFGLGDSAGAHLLGLYTNILTNKDYSKKYKIKTPQNCRFTALALNCGAYQIEFNSKQEDKTSQGLMADFLPCGGSRDELELINVLKGITSQFPPSFIMTAVDDFLKEDSALLVEKLSQLKVPFVYHKYGDKTHRLKHVFHLNIRKKEAIICNDATAEFFKSFLTTK